MANIIEIDRNNNVIILGTTGTTTRLPFCTANRMVYLNSETDITSITDLTAWVAGTTNQITVTDDEDGTITLSTPQSIHTGASPTFVGLTLSSIAAEGTDVDKFLVDSSGVIKYRTGAQVLSDIGGSASGHTHDDRYYTETEINTAFADWVGTENITTLGTIEVGTWEGTSISTTYTEAKCTEATPDYTYISGNDNDTDVTGAELEELTDGSQTVLHSHAGVGTDELVKIDAAATAGYIGAANNDGVLRVSAPLTYTDGGDFITIGTDAGLTSLAGLTYVSDGFIKVTAEDTYAIRTIAETKTDLSLNLVENTALSTWAGTTNITTLGTITTVGNITIADGGTIGQAAGPLLTFDDTLNYLEITGCKVGIGTTTPITDFEVLSMSDDSERGILTHQISDNTGAPQFTFIKERTTGQTINDNDYAGVLFFKFYNDAGTPELITAGNIRCKVDDASDGTEDAQLEIRTITDGTVTTAITLKGNTAGIGTNPAANRLLHLSEPDSAHAYLRLEAPAGYDPIYEFVENGTSRAQIYYETTSNHLVIFSQEADSDVWLIPQGKVRFGSYYGLSGEEITGYILMKTNDGVERKLAVVS